MSQRRLLRHSTMQNDHSRIDGPVAALIALAVALVTDPPPDGPPVYCTVWD